jgi:hypothetical protein
MNVVRALTTLVLAVAGISRGQEAPGVPTQKSWRLNIAGKLQPLRPAK